MSTYVCGDPGPTRSPYVCSTDDGFYEIARYRFNSNGMHTRLRFDALALTPL